LKPQIDRHGVLEEAEGKSFGKVQRGDPEKFLACAHATYVKEVKRYSLFVKRKLSDEMPFR
jgi:hypothetical protein